MNDRYRVTVITAVLALFAVAMGAAAFGVAAQSATVTAEDASIDNVGNTATSTISADASDGIGGLDATVSLSDASNVEISSASIADQPGNSQTTISDQTADSVNISYTDVAAGSQQLDLADVTLEMTGDVQSQVDLNVDVTFARVGGSNNVDTTGEGATVSLGAAPEFDLDVDAPQEVGPGEEFDAEVTVTNNGDAAGSETVTIEGNQQTTGQLAPGESETLQFTVTAPSQTNADIDVVGTDATVTATTTLKRGPNRPGSPGSGQVPLGPAGDRPTVFQGEANIEFVNPNTGNPVDQLISTDDQERVLDVPITTSDEPGTYTLDGDSGSLGVVLQEPEVTDLEIVNINGEDVNSVTQGNNVVIGVDYNYKVVNSPLIVELYDDGGVEVTGQYIDSANVYRDGNVPQSLVANDVLEQDQKTAADNADYDHAVVAQFSDSGQFEVTATADGDDLEEIDSATSTEVVEVASDDDPELELEQDSATQGEEVDFEVTNLDDGDTLNVAIEVDDRRDENRDADAFANEVFEQVGDTNTVDNITTADGNFYYATVEADGTSAIGRIDTEFLDDTTIDVFLYSGGTAQIGDEDFEEDDVTLDVSQAEITIDSPGQTYVPGQEVDLNGTVSEGVEEVSVFVRDRDRYYHVQNISVDDDDNTYDEEDFELSSESATQEAQDIVGQPGVYRYGVIDIQDVFAAANDDETDTEQPFVGGSDGGLTSSDFSSGASNQQSLRVAEPSLEATIETYAGEVYQDDDVDITGTLIGPREYVVLFTDSRGDTVVNTFNADSDDGEIDEEDITLDGLATGDIRASVLSPGRDVEFGDGVLSVSQDTVDDAEANGFLTTPPNREAPIEGTVDNFVGIARAVGVRDNTQTQVTEILLSETVEESGSDDLIVAEEFRLRDDSSTQIEDVVPEQIAENATGVTGIEVGETMVVRGMTNRNPDDATIVVEATEGPSIAELGTAVTEEWGQDGVWNVTIEVPESVEPGQYTIQSDDGDRISEANVTIAAEGTYEEGERAGNQLGELQNQIEELQTQVDNLESERDDLEQQVSDLESENSDLESQLEEAQSQSDTGGNDTQDNGTDDGQGQPGFTAVAALISLIAVALLAIRRQEE